METIEFPDSITEFGNSVIDRSKVKTVHIPLNCKKLSIWGSFDWIPTLEEFTIDENSQYFRVLDGVLYDKNMKTLIAYPPAKKSDVYTIPYGVTKLFRSSTNGLYHLQHLIIPQTVLTVTALYYDPRGLDSINVTVFRYKDQPDSSFNETEGWFSQYKNNYYINYVHKEYYTTYFPANGTVDIHTTGRDNSIFYHDTFFTNFTDIKYVNVGRGIKSLHSECFANSTNIIYLYCNEDITLNLCNKLYSSNFVISIIAMVS